MKVCVIGGGASGLTAAIFAKRQGADVTILEKNSSCGKKLLATGNGRCNYWNHDQSISHYHSSFSDLKSIISLENQQLILEFFSSIGIIPKIKNGYYYPSSNQAESILHALMYEVRHLDISLKFNFLVQNVLYDGNKFFVCSKEEQLEFDKVILTTGGLAALKGESIGIGYDIAKSFGHSILPLYPSLVQLVSNTSFLKNWAGVRCDASVSISSNGTTYKEEVGELQLTDYGISGICIFNLSRYASILLADKKKVFLTINFLPFVKEPILDFFEGFEELLSHRSIGEFLEGILPYKLVRVLLECCSLSFSSMYNALTFKEKETLFNTLVHFTLPIVGSKPFLNAQVTVGGIPLEEINIETFESRKQKGLYFAGEILDVDGDCGGYNLSFAWISGMIAGSNIKRKGEVNDTH